MPSQYEGDMSQKYGHSKNSYSPNIFPTYHLKNQINIQNNRSKERNNTIN